MLSLFLASGVQDVEAKEALSAEMEHALLINRDANARTAYRVGWGLVGGGFLLNVAGLGAGSPELMDVGQIASTVGWVEVGTSPYVSALALQGAGEEVSPTLGLVSSGLTLTYLGLDLAGDLTYDLGTAMTLHGLGGLALLGAIPTAIIQANRNRKVRRSMPEYTADASSWTHEDGGLRFAGLAPYRSRQSHGLVARFTF